MVLSRRSSVRSTGEGRFTDVRSAAMSPFQMVKNLLTPQPPDTESELEQLRRRVAELEERAETRRTGPGAGPEQRHGGRSPAADSREDGTWVRQCY